MTTSTHQFKTQAIEMNKKHTLTIFYFKMTYIKQNDTNIQRINTKKYTR